MIRLFYPKSLYNSKKRRHLFPLLKPFLKGNDFSNTQRQQMYFVSDKDFQLTTDVEKAEIVLLPMSWNFYWQTNSINKACEFIQEMENRKKTVWSFTNGDFGVEIHEFTNLLVFRQSGLRTRLPVNHIGMPSFIEDPLEKFYNTEEVIENIYSQAPVIGFCGQTNSSKLNALKEIVGTVMHNGKTVFKQHHYSLRKIQSTTYLRSQVLDKIKESSQLESKFIERKKYRAGVKTAKERAKTTQEFYDNIKETDYTVCVRGAGNFSVRFYETLAMGRIPVFINTDCLLPLADKIDWKKHVVWIEEDEIDTIENSILHFHTTHSPEEIKKTQQSNRSLWKEKLTLGGFFKSFIDE